MALTRILHYYSLPVPSLELSNSLPDSHISSNTSKIQKTFTFLLLSSTGLAGFTIGDVEQHRGLVVAAAVGLVAAIEPLALQLDHLAGLHGAQAGVAQRGALRVSDSV